MDDDTATLYHHGVIHAMDGSSQTADAMLVRGERIAVIGTLAEVEAVARPGTQRVNLEGRTVIPGFNDCHCHILGLGLNMVRVDTSPDAAGSIPDIARAVRARSDGLPAREWVLGQGYDQNMLAERRHPNRYDLDGAAPDRPVLLWHASMHVLTANSAALAAAGITRNTHDQPGGEIGRDERGEPTGVLKESARILMIRAIPPLSVEAGSAAIEEATRVMASLGITSATDAATGDGTSIQPELEMYRRAVAKRLPVRISLLPQIRHVTSPDSSDTLPSSAFDVGNRPEWLAIGGVKLFSDGAMSTRTAAMRIPYADQPDNAGILLWEPAILADTIRRAHRAGWQIATHALGDRAVEAVLDCYQAAIEEGPWPRGRPVPGLPSRHRMEHCMVMDEGLGRRMRTLGIVPVMQPDIFRLGDGYVDALGPERAAEVIPMQLLARLGIHAAFSSDAPVVPCDPLANIRSAIERKTPSGLVLGRHHAIDAMEAIRLYTVGSAYATRSEGEKGVLRPGMLADFAVLSRDPGETPMDEWSTLRVTQTVVGGEVRFES